MHLLVFIYDEGLAAYIGKKGTEEGIIFYNRLFDGNIIVGLSTNDFEKKIHNAAQAMIMSKQFVISTKNIDKYFGEILIAAELCNKPVIFTDESNIEKMILGLELNYMISTKENILSSIMAKAVNSELFDTTRIDIDSAFNVKGIGCVALGIVTKGVVNVHNQLYHSSGKQVIVKSIQSQDIDVKTAEVNTRVGLALKGIDVDEIGKGDLLSSNKIVLIDAIETELKTSKYANENLENNARYIFISNFSYRTCIIENIEGNKAKIKFEKLLAIEKGDKFLLLRNKTPRIFASGTIL